LDEATFDEIGQGERRLYGPRKLLAVGLDDQEQAHLLGLADGLGDLPVVFALDQDRGETVGALLAQPHSQAAGGRTDLGRAVIMSGLGERELHLLMAAYHALTPVRPLWATLTPTSLNWRLEDLMVELAAERARMEGA